MKLEQNYYYIIKKVAILVSLKINRCKITYFKISLMLRIFTTLVTKLVRVLVMWLRVACAIDMFTQLYEEYWLGGYI